MLGTLSGLAALLTIVCYALIVRTVKNRHPLIWESAGSPGRMFDPTQTSSHQLVGFVHHGSWLHLGDRALIFYCLGYFFFEVSMVITFIAAVFFN